MHDIMRQLEKDEPELFAAFQRLRHLDHRLAQVEEDYEAVATELRQTDPGAPRYSVRLLCELRAEMLKRVRDTSKAKTEQREN